MRKKSYSAKLKDNAKELQKKVRRLRRENSVLQYGVQELEDELEKYRQRDLMGAALYSGGVKLKAERDKLEAAGRRITSILLSQDYVDPATLKEIGECANFNGIPVVFVQELKAGTFIIQSRLVN